MLSRAHPLRPNLTPDAAHPTLSRRAAARSGCSFGYASVSMVWRARLAPYFPVRRASTPFTHQQGHTHLAAKTGLALAQAGEDTLTA